MSIRAITDAAVAREIGVNRSSVTRHRRAHLLPSLVEGVTADPELSALDPLLELRALFARMKRHLASAEETGNLLAIRMIGGEVRAALELFGKFQAVREAQAACPRCQREDEIRGMTPEARRDELSQMLAMVYVHDPAAFLEGLRNQAAIEIAERRRIPIDAARTVLATMEAGEVQGEGSGQA